MKGKFYKSVLLAAVVLIPFISVSAQTAISTFEELDAIRQDLTGSYYLTNDIEIPGTVNWIPIGATDLTSEDGQFFRGTLDGKGFCIKNLTFSTDLGKGHGLFARLNNATIKDLGLVNVDITGKIQVGALAGQFTGESVVERVWVTGKVTGDDTVGGIIGGIPADADNPGYNVIRDCFVNITLTANTFQGGGIIGQLGNANSKVQIENVYVAGKLIGSNVSSNNNMGGIIGFTQSTSVKISSVAIVLDELSGGTPNYVYCRAKVPELIEKVYAKELELVYFADENKGTGATVEVNLLPLENFKIKDLYETNLGWDFTDVWTIKEGEGFPTLKTDSEPPSGIADEKAIECEIYLSEGGFTVAPAGTVSIEIYDITGKLVYADVIESKTSVSANAGLYIVKMKEGNKESARKVLVK